MGASTVFSPLGPPKSEFQIPKSEVGTSVFERARSTQSVLIRISGFGFRPSDVGHANEPGSSRRALPQPHFAAGSGTCPVRVK
jgi:hypothetical protein